MEGVGTASGLAGVDCGLLKLSNTRSSSYTASDLQTFAQISFGLMNASFYTIIYCACVICCPDPVYTRIRCDFQFLSVLL